MVGGGFRGSRVASLSIGRTAVILKADKVDVELSPFKSSRRGGLIGAVHLAPAGCLTPLTPFSASISAAPTFAPAWSS